MEFTMSNQRLLELNNVSKSFPGVNALSNVNFHISGGEIVSLVGANGAGKSTLSHIIAGIYSPDGGGIIIDGKPVEIKNINIADNLGIGMVHQEPTLVPNMTVSANTFLNREILKKGGILDVDKMNEECCNLMEILGYHIDANRRVGELSIVEKTIVEIAKAMHLNPRLLILDEVTAPLNLNESQHLFGIIRELREKGLAIIFIGHRIHEIMEISDRVSVLRDGKLVAEIEKGERMSEREIIRHMLGESGEFQARGLMRDDGLNDDVVDDNESLLLELDKLTIKKYFHDFSLTLRKGEIVGLAGLKGAGITELMKTIYGRVKPESGEIRIRGKKMEINSPRDAISRAGIGFITNDRQGEGLALIRSVSENISVCSLDILKNHFGMIKDREIQKNSRKYVRELNIKTPGIRQEVQYLSGGNQQKIVIAKCLQRDLDIFMIDEPTRGVDIKAKNEIYRLLLEQREAKRGILITSPEIHELINLCDRIIVVVMGHVTCEIRNTDEGFNEANVLELIHMTLPN
jgi:ABC-type sugar transport system ATPase subunit